MKIGNRDNLSGKGGKLYIEGASAEALARFYGTPAYVYSNARIRQNIGRLKEALIKHVPDATIAYSLKANANPALLEIIKKEGTSADCASPEEVKRARAAKFSEIIYTGVYPSLKEIKDILPKTDVLVLDDISRAQALKGVKFDGVLSFRVNPGRGKGSHPGVVTGGDTKFGIPTALLFDAYKEAKRLGVKRFGLHMMVGSGITDWREFIKRADTILKIAKAVEDKVGVEIEVVDMGGGFGIPYKTGGEVLDVERMAKGIGASFKRITKTMRGLPRLVIEPGRYVVGDSGILLTSVASIKEGTRRYVGVDAGMNTIARPAMYGAHHEVLAAGKLSAKAHPWTTVVGQICETSDVIAKDRSLPDLSEGDVIAVLDAGAYGAAMSSRYGHRGFPKEVLVFGKKHKDISEKIATQRII